MQKLIIILSCLLAIVSCSSYYSSNGERQYMQSRNGPDLSIPPPLTAQNISYFYKLPPQTQDPSVSIVPPSQ